MAGMFICGRIIMELKNYIKIRNRIPFLISYCFIDCDKYVSDEIFDNHDFPFIYFHKKELYNEDTNFVISRCSILWKDEEKMEEYDNLSRVFAVAQELYNKEKYDKN